MQSQKTKSVAQPSVPQVLKYGDAKNSLFKTIIYFNANHDVTGTQVISTMYSNDYSTERNQFTGIIKPNFQTFNGYKKMYAFLAKLNKQGKLWHAIFCDNHLMVKDPSGRLLNHVYQQFTCPDGTEKNFVEAVEIPNLPVQY